MKKTASFTISRLLNLLLVLAVIGFSLYFVGKTLGPSVKSLLGLSDISAFDDDIIDRYTESLIEDKEAVDSMKALLYSINRLAWFDTYYGETAWSWDDEIDITEELEKEYYYISGGETKSLGSFNSFGRKYGQTEVIPTIMDMDIITYSGSREEILSAFARNIVECYLMYKDVGKNNIRCFVADFSEIGSLEIDYQTIKGGFRLLEDNPDLYGCNEDCQNVVHGVSGIDRGNPDAWVLDVKGDKITNKNSIDTPENIIRICAEDGSGGGEGIKEHWSDFFTADRIYITTDLSKCKSPVDSLLFGFIVKDFNLPDYDRGLGWTLAGAVQFFTNSYGDPKYITYYEQFPKGEDVSWGATGFEDALAFFAAEVTCQVAVSLVFKLIGHNPVGKPVEAILNAIKARVLICGVISHAVKLLVQYGGDLTQINDQIILLFDDLLYTIRQSLDEIYARLSGVDLKELFDEKHPPWLKSYIIVKYAGKNYIEDNFILLSQEINEEKDFSVLEEDYVNSYIDTIDEFYLTNELLPESSLNPDFTEALELNFKSISIEDRGLEPYKDELAEIMTARIGSFMDTSLFEFYWLFNTVADTNDNLVMLYGSEERIEDISYYQEDNKKIDGFPAKQKHEIRAKIDLATDMAIEEQNLNPLIYTQFGITDSGDINIKLNEKFSQLTQGISLDSFYVSQKGIEDITSERELLTKEIILYKLKSQTESDKFRFMGTNAVGLKTPYRAVIPFDDKHTKSWNWNIDKEHYIDYFEHYGGNWQPLDVEESKEEERDATDEEIGKYYSERYFGLLPEVDRYFLSLVRDQNKIIPGFTTDVADELLGLRQQNIRFHLVSPCKADLLIKVTQCECWGKPTEETTLAAIPDALVNYAGIMNLYETGKYNEIYDLVVPHFDGENPMIYQIDPATGQLIKECKEKNLLDFVSSGLFFDSRYTPLCIEINPIMDQDTNPNYCYRGYEQPFFKVAHFAFNWGLPLAGGTIGLVATAATGGTDLGSMTMLGFSTGSIVGALGDIFLVETLEAACTRWPKHGGIYGCK
ncbi:hypothetical protein JXB41_01500 [Candidatus Woesearchaeota archaeon]|nr:hypothetical protein [Candidatus Woesearchaeota archaeon]